MAALLHPPKLEPFLQLVEQLKTIAEPSGHTVAMGRRLGATTPRVTSAIVGARRKGQLPRRYVPPNGRLAKRNSTLSPPRSTRSARTPPDCALPSVSNL